jgi:hypothetical protein
MTLDQEKLFARLVDQVEHTARQVDQMHCSLVGFEGQGGLHQRVQQIEDRVTELQGFRARLIGVAIAVSTVITVLGEKIAGAILPSK